MNQILPSPRRCGTARFVRWPIISLVIIAGVAWSATPRTPLVDTTQAYDISAGDGILALAEMADGTLWAGSNRLAVFDGTAWHHVAVPEGYAYRALAVAGSRVYVGGRNALGWVEAEPTGTWTFRSLRESLRSAGVTHLGDVWSAHTTAEGVVFTTSSHLLRWDGSSFTRFPVELAPGSRGWLAQGRVHVHDVARGLLRLSVAGLETVITSDDLRDPPVLWVSERPRASDDPRPGPLAVGMAGDAWIETETGWTRWPAASLTAELPVTVTPLGKDFLAIATVKAGVRLVPWPDASGSSAGDVPPINLTGNEAILSLQPAANGDLWAGGTEGLHRVIAPGRVDFVARTAAAPTGPVRAFAPLGDQRIIVTHRGVFSGDLSTFVTVAGDFTPTLIQDVLRRRDDLVIAAFGGIWRQSLAPDTEAPGLQRIHFAQRDVIALAAWPGRPDTLFFSEGYQLRALYPVSDDLWSAQDLGVTLDDTPVSLLVRNDQEVWASTMNGTIYRFSLRESGAGRPRLSPDKIYRPGLELPPDIRRPRLFTIGGRLWVFSDTSILSLQPQGFAAVPALRDFVGVAGPGKNETAPTTYVVVRRKGASPDAPVAVFALDTDVPLAPRPVELPGLDHLGNIEHLTLERSSPATHLWLAGAKGWLRIDERDLAPPAALDLPRLSLIETQLGEQPPQRWPLTAPSGSWSAGTRIKIGFGSAHRRTTEVVHWQSRLREIERDWQPRAPTAFRDFAGLAAGTYTLDMRGVDRWGHTGPVLSHTFHLHPPWFLTSTAYVGYGLGGLALILVGVWGRLARLRYLNRRLEQLVHDRTRELELSNTAKTEFLHTISHEIRNPLNGIVGLTGLLRLDRLPASEREIASSLHACSTRLKRVTEDVLDFARLEYGTPPIACAPFSLRGLIDDVVASFQVVDPNGTKLVTVDCEGDHPLAGDAAKIGTILANFLGNALKYAPGAPVIIHAVATPDGMATRNSAATLTLEVIDHGPGIPEEEQELIFRKFVRGAKARDQHHVSGAGLGLAVCRSLARLLGGKIGVECPRGSGSTFYLQLPVKLVPGAIPPAVQAQPVLPTDTALRPVLVVDDQPYNRMVLCALLRDMNYRPIEACDAQSAITALTEGPFAAIFLDWELPDAHGDSVAISARQRFGDSARLIATTALHETEVEARWRGTVDGYLPKPYIPDDLARLMGAPVTPRPTGFPELAPESNPLFAAAAATHLMSLREASAPWDAERLARSAHALASLLGVAGIVPLHLKARQLEADIRLLSVEELLHRVGEIAATIEEITHRPSDTLTT